MYILKDETQLKVGSEYIWLWIAIEPSNREIMGLRISKERNMFVAERFLSDVVKEYGEVAFSFNRREEVHDGFHHKLSILN